MSTGTQNVQQIAALLLLRGNYGKAGAGICPLRGHSNVQGNRTVGITEKPDPVMFTNVEKAFGFRPPPNHGHDSDQGAMHRDGGRPAPRCWSAWGAISRSRCLTATSQLPAACATWIWRCT